MRLRRVKFEFVKFEFVKFEFVKFEFDMHETNQTNPSEGRGVARASVGGARGASRPDSAWRQPWRVSHAPVGDE